MNRSGFICGAKAQALAVQKNVSVRCKNGATVHKHTINRLMNNTKAFKILRINRLNRWGLIMKTKSKTEKIPKNSRICGF